MQKAVFDLGRCQARKRFRQYLWIKRIATDVEHPSARLCARVQIHEPWRFSEMSADPVRDVVHGERPNALDVPNLAFHESMKRGEVGHLGKLASDPLEPGFDLFE